MTTAKDEVRKLLDKLPDDAFLRGHPVPNQRGQKIQQGLADVQAGRVFTPAEVETRIAELLKQPAHSIIE